MSNQVVHFVCFCVINTVGSPLNIQRKIWDLKARATELTDLLITFELFDGHICCLVPEPLPHIGKLPTAELLYSD